MEPGERRLRTRETYRIIATELDHHFGNGSEWLHLESNGNDSPESVVKLRFKILKAQVDRLRKLGRP